MSCSVWLQIHMRRPLLCVVQMALGGAGGCLPQPDLREHYKTTKRLIKVRVSSRWGLKCAPIFLLVKLARLHPVRLYPVHTHTHTREW